MIGTHLASVEDMDFAATRGSKLLKPIDFFFLSASGNCARSLLHTAHSYLCECWHLHHTKQTIMTGYLTLSTCVRRSTLMH